MQTEQHMGKHGLTLGDLERLPNGTYRRKTATAVPAPPHKTTIRLPIVPQSKPRLTHQGRFSQTAKRYYAYCDALRALATAQRYTPGETLSLTFVLPMPASWTKTQRRARNGQPHQQKPDLDNLIKAFKDALYQNDAIVYAYGMMQKMWGETGYIDIHPA